MSVRPSTARGSRICSGDMKRGEPSIEAVRVMSCSDSPKGFVFEIPKSSTFTSGPPEGPRVTKRFAELDVAVDDVQRVRLGEGLAGLHGVLGGLVRRQNVTLLRHRGEVTPSRYSMTMYGSLLSSVPTS